jgi:hypothetical protein
MTFFIIFSYATHLLNIFSSEQLEDFSGAPVAILQYPRKSLEDLPQFLILSFFRCLAMVWNRRANRLCHLRPRFQGQIDRIDRINGVKPVLISAV